jgi:hypothetical protein
LAAKFPETFLAIFGAVMLAGLAFLVVGFTYDMSVLIGSGAVMKFVAPANLAAARSAVGALRVPVWLLWTVMALNFYMLFLHWLSRRLATEQQNKGAKDR